MRIDRRFFFAIYFLISLGLTPKALGMSRDLVGRLGVGMSQQLINGIPSLSIKLQRSSTFAFGALLGFKNSDADGGLGAGLRLYRILFDEPLLNFYAAGTGAIVTKKTLTTSSSGFQFDFTLGSEFHFAGLESLGFSFEFGFSINKLNENFTLETVGNHILQAGIHFYL